MKRFMRKLEKNTARDIKEFLYHSYLSSKGEHEDKMKGMFESLKNIVLPPMTQTLEKTIISYIERKNKIFELEIIKELEGEKLSRKILKLEGEINAGERTEDNV